MQAKAIMRHRITYLVLVGLLVVAGLLIFGALRAEARETPDCGQNAYEWNNVGQHYGRKFDRWCYRYTYDYAELVYDGLDIGSAVRLSPDEAVEHAFEVDTNMCLGGVDECPGQSLADSIRAKNEFEVWKTANAKAIAQLPAIHERFIGLRQVSGHGPF